MDFEPSRLAAGLRPLNVVEEARRHLPHVKVPGMVEDELRIDGRTVRVMLTDNASSKSDQIWAINIHGFFAGGAMYARESALLAERFGWRVVNPSLPGFGGSDPLPLTQTTLRHLTDEIETIINHYTSGPVLLLGHSMGGLLAFNYAKRQPEKILGIIYRDGVATPAWKERRGPLSFLFGRVAPETAALADLVAAVVTDIPDLLVGRMLSTFRSVIPDVRWNLRTASRTLPIAQLLLDTNLSDEVTEVVEAGIPILCEWGCFDRITNAATAVEFGKLAGVPIHWLPGGHSWMLARPRGQVDVLTELAWGKDFIQTVDKRRREIGNSPRLRAVS